MPRSRSSIFIAVTFIVLIAVSAAAGPIEKPDLSNGDDLIHGRVVRSAKADSVQIYGGPGTLEGQFQTAGGEPDLQGWTPVDNTASPTRWNISDYNCAGLDALQPDNHAWWCGESFPYPNGCGEGYGHNYNESLEYYWTAPDPAENTSFRISARLNLDILDIGYDFLYFQYETPLGWTNLATYSQTMVNADFFVEFDIQADEYVGPGNDQIHLRWYFTSDGLWDDQDCYYDSQGGAQIDRIAIEARVQSQPGPFSLVGTVETCEPGDPVQWSPVQGAGTVGNFGKVWPQLDDDDPCRDNDTPQVAFIDDGLVVPGTGGYMCQAFCYGPGGHVVNPEGGLAGPDYHIDNQVWSPVFDWPGPQYNAAILSFDVYTHEVLDAISPGIFYEWYARTSHDGLDISLMEWENDSFLWSGGPAYQRRRFNITTDVALPSEQIQLALGIAELGYLWGWNQTNASPAPYFDNVSLVAYVLEGPLMSAYTSRQAQDSFPESGTLDLVDLSQNSVRFDMARSLDLSDGGAVQPGDSVTVEIGKSELVLDGPPKLHYRVLPNPLFDAYRSAVPQGAGNTSFEGAVSCAVSGDPADNSWFADLPDTGFFFPGDVINYYFRAEDTTGGASILPADTTGFSGGAYYNELFSVRALPSLDDALGAQPTILLWDDSGSSSELDAWLTAMAVMNLEVGEDFDLYSTNYPQGAVGSGLGGRATSPQLAGYSIMLYTSGTLASKTINSHGFQDGPGNDLAALDNWLAQNDKNLLVMGDGLMSDLEKDIGSLSFMNVRLGVDVLADDVSPYIDGQDSPQVMPQFEGEFFTYSADGWELDGGCPTPNTFDNLSVYVTGSKIAEFLTPAGAPHAYLAAAVVRNVNVVNNLQFVSAPFGLKAMRQYSGGPSKSDQSTQAMFLADVLFNFGNPVVSETPRKPALSLASHPNPFNPQTRIEYSLDRAGFATLDIFDLRGRKVRRLLAGDVASGPHTLTWNGRGDDGQAVASGIYFCILEAPGGRREMKLTLIR